MINDQIQELVVLVDENDNELGTAPKATVHGLITPLHRAFSAFIFNKDKKLLVQQRSSLKRTWPLVWSNSFCGHPGPNEDRIEALNRRAREELGVSVKNVKLISPYRYTFVRDKVMENEICPIYIGILNDEPKINPNEVEAIVFMDWSEFVKESRDIKKYSEWSSEQALILDNSQEFKDFLNSI